MNDDFDLSALFAARPPQRRKRGGLAGVWDRNKHIIKPVAAGLAGLATGGLLAPTLMGAAMGGLDREGKGGIGFDVGQGLRGAGEGALAGSAGRGLGRMTGIKPFLGGGQAAASTAGAPTTTGTAPAVTRVADPIRGGTVEIGRTVGTPATSAASGTGGFRNFLGSAGRFIQANPNAVGMGLQAGSNILGSQAERRMADERIRLERERDEEERRRRATIAALLLPQVSPDMFGRR